MRQEELRREKKQQKTLQDVTNIFVDAFDIQNVDEETPIIDQLVNIIDQVSAENFESNEKLIDWSTTRIETEVVDKVLVTITE